MQLHCPGCHHSFEGPAGATECPQCHMHFNAVEPELESLGPPEGRTHLEFTSLAVAGLAPDYAHRVGLALDIAILFGVLEYLDGNESLRHGKVKLEAAYIEKLAELRAHADVIPEPLPLPVVPPLLAAVEAEAVERFGAQTVEDFKGFLTEKLSEFAQALEPMLGGEARH